MVRKPYTTRKSQTVSVHIPAEHHSLVQWLEARSAKEKRTLSYLILRALLFERDRVMDLELNRFEDQDLLEYVVI
jgi:hypothetical protein